MPPASEFCFRCHYKKADTKRHCKHCGNCNGKPHATYCPLHPQNKSTNHGK